MAKARMYTSAKKHTSRQALALQFSTNPPSTVTQNADFTVIVRALKADGTTNTSFVGAVTVTLLGSTQGVTGLTTKNAIGGFATFVLSVVEAKNGLQFRATASGYASTVSSTFAAAAQSSGGGGSLWTFPGSRAPAGLVYPFSVYQGDALPSRNRYSAGGENAYGMSSLISQSYCYSIVADPDSPSGFALRTRFPAIGAADAARGWAPPDYGGAAPARMVLRSSLNGGGRKPRFIYIKMFRKYSPSYTQAQSVLGLDTTSFTGRSAAGTTARHIVCEIFSGGAWVSPGWAPNVHAGKMYRHGTVGARGPRIVSNGSNTLEVDDDIGGDYSGVACSIVVTSSGGSPSSNFGTKGPFFPRLGATLTWAGTDPKQGDVALYDNPYVGGFHNFDNGSAAAVLNEGVTYSYGNQNSKTWDGVELDVNGYPRWRGSTDGGGQFAVYPPRTLISPYTPGMLLKEEILMQINTPGQNNGKFRAYVNDVLVATSDVVAFVQPYYSAVSIGNGLIPTIGGSLRDVALIPTNPYWTYLQQDYTFGGGLRVPTVEMWQDTLAVGIGLSDTNMI